jgi:hypothetical protein
MKGIVESFHRLVEEQTSYNQRTKSSKQATLSRADESRINFLLDAVILKLSQLAEELCTALDNPQLSDSNKSEDEGSLQGKGKTVTP